MARAILRLTLIRRRWMRANLVVLALAVGVAFVSAAGASVAAKQRIIIMSTDTHYAFALIPASKGPVRRDSGTITWADPVKRFVKRDGQRIQISNVSATFTGNRGTFILRFRIEWTNPGHRYSVGTNMWAFVSGTGPYSPIRGGGRGVSILPPRGFPFFRLEGLVSAS
jgi:hypothetical protein